MYHLCVWCLWRLEKGVESLGTSVAGGYGLPSECQEPNTGSPQEQRVLLPWSRLSGSDLPFLLWDWFFGDSLESLLFHLLKLF